MSSQIRKKNSCRAARKLRDLFENTYAEMFKNRRPSIQIEIKLAFDAIFDKLFVR